MKNKILCLYTNQFPYGKGEQFIETEIMYLATAFDKVYLIPQDGVGEVRSLPQGIEVINFKEDYSTPKGIKSIGLWIVKLLPDLLKTKQASLQLSLLMRNAYRAMQIKRILKEYKIVDAVHYSYWFDAAATQLAILKYEGVLKSFISRAHGYDLYEDRNLLGFIPYRQFQLQQVSKLYLISKDGFNYISDKYYEYKCKYELSYLGVERQFEPQTLPPREKDIFVLVSCSRIVDIKRVHLIVEALALIDDVNIHWIHFGDGSLSHDVQTLAKIKLQSNITYTFKGMVFNQDIYKFYASSYINCFINVSSSEGLPVSIMEAISYGIPIVATDVGGTSEIVNKQTGILISQNPTAKEICKAILKINDNRYSNVSIRQEIKEYWNLNFNSRNNYSDFTKSLQT